MKGEAKQDRFGCSGHDFRGADVEFRVKVHDPDGVVLLHDGAGKHVDVFHFSTLDLDANIASEKQPGLRIFVAKRIVDLHDDLGQASCPFDFSGNTSDPAIESDRLFISEFENDTGR